MTAEMRRGLVAAALSLALAACSTGPLVRAPSTDADAASPSGEPSASAKASPAPAESVVPTPRTTPPGTPAPTPDEVTVASAEIATPPPAPTATRTPQPGLWRLGGYIVDESGVPLSGVCVVVGPHGCKEFSPHTDDRGYWWLDIAEGTSTFDFYFERPGFNTVWWHVTPTGAIEHNVVLTKS